MQRPQTSINALITAAVEYGAEHVDAAIREDNVDVQYMDQQAVERHRASFAVIAFAIFYAGHGQDNYKIFKSYLAPED